MKLREYQQNGITCLFNYMYENPGKNPCLVCPTGSGKSVMIAEFCRYSLTSYPGTRILVLSHQKELIEQDAKALKKHWDDADIGLYSAALRCKQLEQPIIFASIQSIYKVSGVRWDLVLIDEVHLVNNEDTGMYRKFLERIRPSFVIGFTATPYRMGQGLITDEPSIFSDIINVISIAKLQEQNYLAMLRSKSTSTHYDLTKVRVRGGEFIESDLQEATSDFETNEKLVDEIIKSGRYYDREHWLIFCTGVQHARDINQLLNDKGIKSVVVTGDMRQEDREEALYSFTSGTCTAICNANLLTTGFDYPDIDMICMLRATLSPGLYMQCLGRGLRLKSGKNKDCLVLDFAENVMRHGPITDVVPPSSRKKSDKLGVAPCKECPECLEIVPAQTKTCPACGYVFPKNERLWTLFNGDVNGGGYAMNECSMWTWYKTTSRKSNKEMIVIDYKLDYGTSSAREFLLYKHEGYAYRKSLNLATLLCSKFRIEFASKYATNLIREDRTPEYDWEAFSDDMSLQEAPKVIITKKEGKYSTVIDRLWDDDIKEMQEAVEEERRKADETRRAIIG